MKTKGATNHRPNLPVVSGTSTNHPTHDGKCFESSCPVQAPHNHTVPEYGCLNCIKDYLEKIFPLEQTIKNLKINDTFKQLVSMVSNLAPAMATSHILNPLHIDSFVASPLALSAMHFTNRGTKQLYKLAFTSLSSIAVTCMQRFLSLPRALVRPVMALAVFFIERNGNGKKNEPHHVHDSTCHHDHDFNSDKLDKNNVIAKQDWMKLLKLQGQINTVPWVINLCIDKLKERNSESPSLLKKFFGHIGISALQIGALSLGFVGLGHLIDKALLQFGFITSEESLAMRAEGAVCACCGAPVCVAEAASEVGSLAAV